MKKSSYDDVNSSDRSGRSFQKSALTEYFAHKYPGKRKAAQKHERERAAPAR